MLILPTFSCWTSFTATLWLQLANAPDDIFQLTSGVRQGGPESPLLYNLYMDYVMHVCMAEQGIEFLNLKYRMRNTMTTSADRMTHGYQGDFQADWSGYADDLELFTTGTHHLQLALELLDEMFHRYFLKITVVKTETMIFNYKYTDDSSHNIAYPKSILSLNNMPVKT